MRMVFHNRQRQYRFTVDVDLAQRPAVLTPPADGDEPVELRWEAAVDDHGHLTRCPACACRELFARKDFPQKAGLSIVAAGAIAAVTLFAADRIAWGLIVLMGIALIDAMIYPFAKRCLVCYRCRSEFHRLPIRRDHPGWDLATGEKYRSVHTRNEHTSLQ